jgi:predicted phosphodiesterase
MIDPKYIRIASDLHLEGFLSANMANTESRFLPIDNKDFSSILVLAGDISSNIKQLHGFLKFIEYRFHSIIYVIGNHELYYQNMSTWFDAVKTSFEDLNNIYFSLNDTGVFVIGTTRFVVCPLWADGGGDNPIAQSNVQRGLNDFRIIKNGEKIFTVTDMIAIHKKQKSDIDKALSKKFDGATVVVTHHLPSHQLCHPRFGNSINGGFASNCDDMLIQHKPDLWIHGHTHDTIDTKLYDVRIVANPRGYSTESNKSVFNTYGKKFIDISTLKN